MKKYLLITMLTCNYVFGAELPYQLNNICSFHKIVRENKFEEAVVYLKNLTGQYKEICADLFLCALRAKTHIEKYAEYMEALSGIVPNLELTREEYKALFDFMKDKEKRASDADALRALLALHNVASENIEMNPTEIKEDTPVFDPDATISESEESAYKGIVSRRKVVQKSRTKTSTIRREYIDFDWSDSDSESMYSDSDSEYHPSPAKKQKRK